MVQKILLVSTCAERLHESEFVKPVERILKEIGVESFVRKFNNVKKKDQEKKDQDKKDRE